MNERIRDAVEAANRRRSDWQVRELPIPDHPVPGGIYRLVNYNFSGLFTLLEVLDNTEHECVFAAMSPFTEYATSWDIVVDSENSPMGAGFIVEIWNRVVMGRSAVDAFFGRLSSQPAVGVGELYIEWLKKGAGNAEKFQPWNGSKLNWEYDWRHEFQKQEIERIGELAGETCAQDTPRELHVVAFPLLVSCMRERVRYPRAAADDSIEYSTLLITERPVRKLLDCPPDTIETSDRVFPARCRTSDILEYESPREQLWRWEMPEKARLKPDRVYGAIVITGSEGRYLGQAVVDAVGRSVVFSTDESGVVWENLKGETIRDASALCLLIGVAE